MKCFIFQKYKISIIELLLFRTGKITVNLRLKIELSYLWLIIINIALLCKEKLIF